MKKLQDCFGSHVRLTDERLAHILEHPEMKDLTARIEEALSAPEIVRGSRWDPSVRLFHRFQTGTAVGDKWLCVVVKYTDGDSFVVTAYLTDKPKEGEELWPRK